MKGKDVTPLIMGFVLLGGIVAIGSLRISRMPGVWEAWPVNFDVPVIGLYVLWMIVELRVSGKDVDTEGKKTSDFATCQLYGLGQALTILTALWFPSLWRSPSSAHFAGIGLFLTGVCYRLWAVQTLGRLYSHRVRTVTQHPIVSSGPYRFTRHPAYAGMITAHSGIALYFFNWVTICVLILILVPAIRNWSRGNRLTK